MYTHGTRYGENIVRDNDDYVNAFPFINLIGMGIAHKCKKKIITDRSLLCQCKR